MSDKLDDLFGGDPGFPARESRIRWIRGLVWVGTPMVLLGLAGCFGYPYFVLTWLSVPGAALFLFAWLLSDTDLTRVESGHLSIELASDLEKYRRWAILLLCVSAVSFMVQMKFLMDGTYESWLSQLAEDWGGASSEGSEF